MTLLVHLASRPGVAVSKDELGRLMYEGKVKPATNCMEVFVGRIRRKIDPDNSRKPIKTVRYSGYSFRNDW
jgi:two-component system response regulator PhoP